MKRILETSFNYIEIRNVGKTLNLYISGNTCGHFLGMAGSLLLSDIVNKDRLL